LCCGPHLKRRWWARHATVVAQFAGPQRVQPLQCGLRGHYAQRNAQRDAQRRRFRGRGDAAVEVSVAPEQYRPPTRQPRQAQQDSKVGKRARGRAGSAGRGAVRVGGDETVYCSRAKLRRPPRDDGVERQADGAARVEFERVGGRSRAADRTIRGLNGGRRHRGR